jgi:hypothetical protein
VSLTQEFRPADKPAQLDESVVNQVNILITLITEENFEETKEQIDYIRQHSNVLVQKSYFYRLLGALQLLYSKENFCHLLCIYTTGKMFFF